MTPEQENHIMAIMNNKEKYKAYLADMKTAYKAGCEAVGRMDGNLLPTEEQINKAFIRFLQGNPHQFEVKDKQLLKQDAKQATDEERNDLEE